MEENQKVVQLKGLSNSQLLEQFKNIIIDREVESISLFITFKPNKKQSLRAKDKNVQDKTYEALSSLKQKKNFDVMLENIRASFQPKITEQVTFVAQITKLYQEGAYEEAIKILKPKQTQYFLKQNTPDTCQDRKMKTRNQYNFITFTIGNCYFRLKSHDQAIDYYQKIIQQQPIRQHAQRMNNLGTCFAIKNSFQQALKAYNEALKIYNQIPQQDMSSLLNNIAMIYLKSDMLKIAQQYFQQSIKQRKAKSPNNKAMLYNSYFNLGICQKKNKRLQESLNNLFFALNYACEGFGKKTDVYTQICLVYEQQEKWSEALSYYEKLSEQCDNQKKCQAMVYERVSKIHEKLGNTYMAAKFAKKALKMYSQQGNQRKVSEMSSCPLVNMQNIP